MVGFEQIASTLFTGICLGSIYALIGVGLNLIWGVSGVFNFAHPDFVMIGMYCCFWLFTLFGIDPMISLMITFPLFFLIGMVTQKTLIRQVSLSKMEYQFLLTFGLSLVIQSLALMFWTADFRSLIVPYNYQFIDLLGVRLNAVRILALTASLVTVGLLYLYIFKTVHGKKIVATADNRELAVLSGINVGRIEMITFAISISLAAVAGCFLSLILYTFPYVGNQFGLLAIVVVVIGGLGSFPGSVAGGLIVGVVSELGAMLAGSIFKGLFFFIIFILVLLLRPSGLLGKK